MKYEVNDQELSYEAIGQEEWGMQEILLDNARDLTAASMWSSEGFTIERFLDASTYARFEKTAKELLTDCWRRSGLSVPTDFQPEQYHILVSGFEQHLRAVEMTKLLSTESFPIPIAEVEEQISDIIKIPLRAFNPYDTQSVFHFRVIRPGSSDNNPLHRDVWLEDYDNCLNLYIPIVGSNENSSLILAPGSHRWPESKVKRTLKGALINGVKYNVPAVTEIRDPFSFVRPDPAQNEVLIFSPYLIHGGASNLNKNTTRISIELRLWARD